VAGQARQGRRVPLAICDEPEIVLDEPDWVPAAQLAPALDHAAKWPPEHWTLAFQGQIRAVSEHDAALLMERMGAMVAAP
jgi:hypothetical protein